MSRCALLRLSFSVGKVAVSGLKKNSLTPFLEHESMANGLLGPWASVKWATFQYCRSSVVSKCEKPRGGGHGGISK